MPYAARLQYWSQKCFAERCSFMTVSRLIGRPCRLNNRTRFPVTFYLSTGSPTRRSLPCFAHIRLKNKQKRRPSSSVLRRTDNRHRSQTRMFNQTAHKLN